VTIAAGPASATVLEQDQGAERSLARNYRGGDRAAAPSSPSYKGQPRGAAVGMVGLHDRFIMPGRCERHERQRRRFPIFPSEWVCRCRFRERSHAGGGGGTVDPPLRLRREKLARRKKGGVPSPYSDLSRGWQPGSWCGGEDHPRSNFAQGATTGEPTGARSWRGLTGAAAGWTRRNPSQSVVKGARPSGGSAEAHMTQAPGSPPNRRGKFSGVLIRQASARSWNSSAGVNGRGWRGSISCRGPSQSKPPSAGPNSPGSIDTAFRFGNPFACRSTRKI